ncbi:MAG: hypothetical protein IIB38_12035 [Candidatus Hydrogenedentes bacterium]|nr:hypothetical protein [Candidatus Hydrogenedentota bacterium]
MSEPSALPIPRRFSRAALASLFLVNLLPLAGVVAFEWNLHTLIRVYWVENVVVGVATLAKIGLAKQVGPVGKTKLYKVLLFTAFYGTFWVIHGAILSRVVFETPLDGPYTIDFLFVGAVLAFAISHGIAIKFAHWDAREHEKVTAFTQMLLPFVRVAPTHAVLILVALLVLRLGTSTPLLAGVVALKVALDIIFHLREHGGIAKL